MRKKFVLIAKCYDSISGGPTGVIKGLIRNFADNGMEIDKLLLKEKQSKMKFIKDVFAKCFSENGAVINVHTDGFMIPMLVYIASRFARKNSYYLTVHGIYCIESKIEGKAKIRYILLEKILYRRFPNLVCVSEMLKNDIIEIFHRSNKIYVIPNATDAKSNVEPNINNEQMSLISVGGLRKIKGIDELIELAGCLKTKEIPAVINIYGSTESNEEWFVSKVQENDLQDNIIFHGMITDKQAIYDLIAGADIQLCLSKHDTFNVAIAESLVLGCPVVSTDLCGAAYLIQGDSGIVISIEKEKEEHYEHVIDYIKKAKEIRATIYQNREKYAEQLSWKSIVDSYAFLE